MVSSRREQHEGNGKLIEKTSISGLSAFRLVFPEGTKRKEIKY